MKAITALATCMLLVNLGKDVQAAQAILTNTGLKHHFGGTQSGPIVHLDGKKKRKEKPEEYQ